MLKNGNFMTRDFSLLIKRVLAGVDYKNMQWSSAKRKSSLNGNFILMLGLFLAISFHSVFKQEMISFLPLHIGKIK